MFPIDTYTGGLVVLSITQLTNASILRIIFLMVTILLLMIISRYHIVMTINRNDKKVYNELSNC